MRITTIIHTISLLLKVIVIFILFQSLPFAISEYFNGQQTLHKYNFFTDNDLMVIKDFNVGDDIASLTGENTLDRAAINLYKKLSKGGHAIYAYFYAFMPSSQIETSPNQNENQYTLATVDTTYLHTYSLLSEEMINEIESRITLTLLVPESFASKQDELLEYVNLYRNESNEIDVSQLLYYKDRAIPVSILSLLLIIHF